MDRVRVKQAPTPRRRKPNRAPRRNGRRDLIDATGYRPVVSVGALAPLSMLIPFRSELVTSTLLLNLGAQTTNRSFKVSDVYQPFSALGLTGSAVGFNSYLGAAGSSTALYQQFRVLQYDVQVDISNTQTFPIAVGGFISNASPTVNSANVLPYAASGIKSKQLVASASGGGSDTVSFIWKGSIQQDVGSLISRYDDSYTGTGGSVASGPASPGDNLFLTLWATSSVNFVSGIFVSARLKLDTLVFERALPIA